MSAPDSLVPMVGLVEKTADLFEKSVALLAESAILLGRKGANVDLSALRARQMRMAERHVADGERLVRRQRELVARLERDGHDARAAKLLLRQFEEMHHLQVVHLNTLRDAANAEPSHSAG